MSYNDYVQQWTVSSKTMVMIIIIIALKFIYTDMVNYVMT